MILTGRFRSREGFLYTIHCHETGLEAFPVDGVEQPREVASPENCHKALAFWCERTEELSEEAR